MADSGPDRATERVAAARKRWEEHFKLAATTFIAVAIACIVGPTVGQIVRPVDEPLPTGLVAGVLFVGVLMHAVAQIFLRVAFRRRQT